jgi:hypothetical protein
MQKMLQFPQKTERNKKGQGGNEIMSHSRLYRIFWGMKNRCYNPKRKDFKDYGGRGITICDDWLNMEEVPNTWHSTKGWLAFKTWALTHGYNDEMTIDRIDVNKGYSPENCRWVTMKVQSNNARSNRLITYKNKTQTLMMWCEELGLQYERVWFRLYKKHWTVDKAFEQPKLR